MSRPASVPAVMIAVLASLLAGGCALLGNDNCVKQEDGGKVCSIADKSTGLTTRTIEYQGRLFVSTCQMSQCSPFEEIGNGPGPPAPPAPRRQGTDPRAYSGRTGMQMSQLKVPFFTSSSKFVP